MVLVGMLAMRHDQPPFKSKKLPDVWRSYTLALLNAMEKKGKLPNKFYLLWNSGDGAKQNNPSGNLLAPSELKDKVIEEIRGNFRQIEVIPREMSIKNEWDMGEVFRALLEQAEVIVSENKPEQHEILVNLTNGSGVERIALHMLVTGYWLPGSKAIQVLPEIEMHQPDDYNIVDVDLSHYPAVAEKFTEEEHECIRHLKDGIATKSKIYNALLEELGRIVASPVFNASNSRIILLLGPTGSGKSKLARQIYSYLQRKGKVTGKFMKCNCATLNLEPGMGTSALFGYAKGAYTGATEEKNGIVKAADCGVLFLDEIGELSLEAQTRLLTVLDEHVFQRLGGTEDETADFLLICATNKNLREAIRQGTFREDFYQRISTWVFNMPGLKERREDLKANLDFTLGKIRNDCKQNLTMNRLVEEEFMTFAREYHWPGNFREFQRIFERLRVLAKNGEVSMELMKAQIAKIKSEASDHGNADETLLEKILGKERSKELTPLEKNEFLFIAEQCRGSKTLAELGRLIGQNGNSLNANNKVPNFSDLATKKLQSLFGEDRKGVELFSRITANL